MKEDKARRSRADWHGLRYGTCDDRSYKDCELHPGMGLEPSPIQGTFGEENSEYEDLQFHTEVCSLSHPKLLHRFDLMCEEIHSFMTKEGENQVSGVWWLETGQSTQLNSIPSSMHHIKVCETDFMRVLIDCEVHL